MPDDTPTGGYQPAAQPTDTTPHVTGAGASTVDPNRTKSSPTPDGTTAQPSFPGYEIIEELGRGGMGVVYKARQTTLNRLVALKMIRAAATASGAEVARFLAEAEAVAAVRHPNVVQVFECGRHDGQPYMALEFLPGDTLTATLKATGRLDPHAAAELVVKVAAGVQAAHEQGIVHRDLKPSNVLFDDTDEPKVADFGIARRGGSDVTATGAVVGTPHYMAPEQAAGRAKFVGPAADIYALGVILYECLTGTVPFKGEDVWSVIRKVINDPPPSLRRSAPGTPRDLELICLKCLAKEPHERYASAAELGDDLRRFLDGKPVTARPLGSISRAWRAVKRNPVIAGAVTAVVLSSTIGAAIALVKADEAEAEAKRANEETEKTKKALADLDEKEKERAKAEGARATADAAEKRASALALRNSRMALYSKEIGDARRWLSEGSIPSTEEALEACPPDLRGWEWRFVKQWLNRRAGYLPPITGPLTPSCVAVSPDSRWLAVGGMERDDQGAPGVYPSLVWLWDLKTGGPPVKLPGQFVGVMPILAFDPESRFLVGVTGEIIAPNQPRSELLRVWDVTNLARPVLEVGTDPPFLPKAVRFTPGAISAILAARDPGFTTRLKTWSLVEKTPPSEIQFNGKDGVTCAAFAPGGTRIVLVGQREGPPVPNPPLFARILQTDGKPIGHEIAVDTGVQYVTFAPFAPGGQGVVFGGMDPIRYEEWLASWDGESPTFTRRSKFEMGSVRGLQLRADGKVVPTPYRYGYAGVVRAWNPATGELEVLASFPNPFGLGCFSDGRRFAIGDRTGARVWDPVDYHTRTFGAPDNPADRFVLLSGERVALLSSAGYNTGIARPRVRVANLGGGPFEEFTPEPSALGYNAAVRVGDRLAIWADLGFGKPTQILLFDPATRTVIHRWTPPEGLRFGALTADATGSRIAFGGSGVDRKASPEDRGVKIYSAITGKLERALPLADTKTFPVDLAFSHDGRYLAVARNGPRFGVPGKMHMEPGGVTVWDASTGAVVKTFDNISGGVNCVAFSPDDSLLAVGGDTLVRVWGTADWSLHELRLPSGGLQPGRVMPSVHSLDFSPDGTRLVASGMESTALWDVASGQLVLSIPQSCLHVAFTPDGRRLVGSAIGKVLVYAAGP